MKVTTKTNAYDIARFAAGLAAAGAGFVAAGRGGGYSIAYYAVWDNAMTAARSAGRGLRGKARLAACRAAAEAVAEAHNASA